jgi:hypothetical protein
VALMTTQVTAQLDTNGLIDEVRRYLVAVEAFRAEGLEPRWSTEESVAAVEPAQMSIQRRKRWA